MIIDAIHAVLEKLAHSENAMSLQDFQNSIDMPVNTLAEALDMLALIGIFICDNSYHQSEVGIMVYSFSDNDIAQKMYKLIIEGDRR